MCEQSSNPNTREGKKRVRCERDRMEVEMDRQMEKKNKEEAMVPNVFCLLLHISKTLQVLFPKKKALYFSQETSDLLQRQATVYS